MSVILVTDIHMVQKKNCACEGEGTRTNTKGKVNVVKCEQLENLGEGYQRVLLPLVTFS